MAANVVNNNNNSNVAHSHSHVVRIYMCTILIDVM